MGGEGSEWRDSESEDIERVGTGTGTGTGMSGSEEPSRSSVESETNESVSDGPREAAA
jgi:hypothetical protein